MTTRLFGEPVERREDRRFLTGRGRYVAELMRQSPGVEYGATADVYLPNAERAKEWAGPKAAAYQDFRRLLDRKDIDAVHIATPDHWHAITTVLACQAGKDVYVEKPLTLDVNDGLDGPFPSASTPMFCLP